MRARAKGIVNEEWRLSPEGDRSRERLAVVDCLAS